MLRQIVLDTETTGLSPEDGHRVIEVGCLEMVNRRITGDYFHRYTNPERDIERAAEEIHGLTSEFLADKPKFTDIVDELIQYIDGAELIIHNAPFDVGFLNHEFKLTGKKYKKVAQYCGIIDTLALARRKHPGQHNNLDALCRRYSVDNSNRDLHGALIDAELLAQVYLLMTGGQTQLFGSMQDDVASNNVQTTIRRLPADRKHLPVIRPNSEELKLHEEFTGLLVAD